MTVGTKSLLFGVHCFFIHPITVAIAWIKLFGFPFDPRIWISFIVHDWGYFGCTDMDGESGKYHPKVGADIMSALFGKEWGDFCLYHSRSVARSHNAKPSLLCIADKLAWSIEPYWLYLPRAKMSGELKEYMKSAEGRLPFSNEREWYSEIQSYGIEISNDMLAGGDGKWCSSDKGK